jgi:branched-chain amino acid transport system substrate-binding protein
MRRSFAMVSLAGLLWACPKSTGGQSNAASAQAHAELEAARQKADSGDPAAQAELQRLQQQYANTDVAADALFSEGELAYGRKDYAAAREKYRALLLQAPLFPRGDDAREHLGQCSLQLGDFRDALTTLLPLYDKLPADRKPAAAATISKAAVGAHDWAQAVRFLAEGEGVIADPAARAQLEKQLAELVDSQVPQLEVAKLAQQLSPASPAYALVLFKLARIQFHLHDWSGLKETLTTLQQKAPGNAFAPEAEKLLERAARRDQVKPNAIGVLLPLSGKYQRFGETALAGIKLAVGSGVQLVVKDSAGDPDQAKRVVQELVLDDQVVAVIGPIISAEALAAATSADELGVPIITLSRDESLAGRGPYVFRDMLTNSAQARALVDYATRVRGFTTFGVLYPNIPYGSELVNAFWDDVLASGGAVNAAESYDHDQTTFGPVVQKLVGRYYKQDRADYLAAQKEINQAGEGAYKSHREFDKLKKNLAPIVDFEALFIPDQSKNVGLIAPALAVEDIVTNGCDARDMERIAKTMGLKKTSDVKSILLLGANGWDAPELVERGGKFVQCAVFVDGFYAGSARDATRKFVASFNEHTGKNPDLLAAYGFDAGSVVKSIVGKEHPAGREAFRDALSRVKNLPGASGPVTATPTNDLEHPLFFLTIDRNGMKEVDVAAEAARSRG